MMHMAFVTACKLCNSQCGIVCTAACDGRGIYKLAVYTKNNDVCNGKVRCAGMQDELGFTLRGTTDAALVLQQSISVGAPANGLRWLWELNPRLHPPIAGVPARSSSDFLSSTSSNVGQVCQYYLLECKS